MNLVPILNEVFCVSLRANALWKGMKSSLRSQTIKKIVEWLGNLAEISGIQYFGYFWEKLYSQNEYCKISFLLKLYRTKTHETKIKL